MRKPEADYRKLRFHNIKTDEFRHLKLLLGWVIYFLLYFLTEQLILSENCHLIHSPLDDRIPFCEFFALFYVGWYGLVALSLLWFMLYHIHSFRHLQTYIFSVQMVATAVYILYPSRQTLRPVVFPRQNVLTDLMGLIYRIDTPTGIFPSLHVAVSLGIALIWMRERSVALWIRLVIALFCLGVCLSVVFVKQHSVLDIFAAIPLCLLGEWVAFFLCGC